MRLTTLLPAAAVTLGVLLSPAAHANPDPHMPSGPNGYCPGGLSGYDMPGSCMGEPYPDGTRWIDAFSSPNPMSSPVWKRLCSFDRPNRSIAEFDYTQQQGCGRNG